MLHWFIDLLICWFIDPLVHWFVDSLIHWFTQWAVHGFSHFIVISTANSAFVDAPHNFDSFCISKTFLYLEAPVVSNFSRHPKLEFFFAVSSKNTVKIKKTRHFSSLVMFSWNLQPKYYSTGVWISVEQVGSDTLQQDFSMALIKPHGIIQKKCAVLLRIYAVWLRLYAVSKFTFLGEGFQLATGDVDFTNLGRTGGTRWPKPGDEWARWLQPPWHWENAVSDNLCRLAQYHLKKHFWGKHQKISLRLSQVSVIFFL